MAWKPFTTSPERDGAYSVRVRGGMTIKAWFIVRKSMWVTMDGAECLDGLIEEWRTKRLQKPEWEICQTKKGSA